LILELSGTYKFTGFRVSKTGCLTYYRVCNLIELKWLSDHFQNNWNASTNNNQGGMQKEELRAGGMTQTRWGPGGLQLIFDSSTSGSPS
jgi:hypothetical protein